MAVDFQIKRIDVIYNPEYDQLTNYYRLPIFFKSLPVRSQDVTYLKQGFVDNGRKRIRLMQDHEKTLEQM